MRNILFVVFSAIWGTIYSAPDIVLGEKATKMEDFAAREVQRVWKVAVGEDLQITNIGKAGAGDIVIGTPATNPAVAQMLEHLQLSDEKPDEAVIYEFDRILYIAGIKPRTAVDAAMLFLREKIGARWLWWGEDGEYIPQHKGIDFNGIARRQNPGIAIRGISPKGIHMPEEFELYLSRNFGNILFASEYDIPHKRVPYAKTRPDRGLPMILGGHNAYLPPFLFKKRPELFALVNGERNPSQLCLSHPENPQLMAERLFGIAEKFGGFEEIRMSSPDNMSYCRCPKCIKTPHTVLYFRFIDQAAGKLKEKMPGVRVATLAYQGYLLPPKELKLQHVDRVDYCPYDRCFSHKSTHPDCPANKKSFGNIELWRKTGVGVGIYGYFFDSISPEVAMPMGGVIYEEIQRYRELGVTLIDPEISINKPADAPLEQQASVNYRLLCYIYLQSMYNPDITLPELIRDWSNAAFGAEAAPIMAEYYMAQIDAYDKLKLHLTGMFSLPYQITEELFNGDLGERCDAILGQADKKISDSRHRTNFERELRLYRTLRRAAQSTIRESFALLPVQNEGEQPYTAALGLTNADIRYTPEVIKIRVAPDSEIMLATIQDESSDKIRSITVSKDGRTNFDNILSDKQEDGRFEISIPFTWLKVAMPLPGETWRLGIQSNQKYYPEKLVNGKDFDYLAYAVFSGRSGLVREMLVLLTPDDVKRGNANAFRSSAHELGFMVNYIFSPDELQGAPDRYDASLLRTEGMQFSRKNFIELEKTLKQRSVLVISSQEENLQLEKLFDDPVFTFKRVEILSSADARHAAESASILLGPENLKWFGNRYPPLYSLVPVRAGEWQPLLTALDKNRETVPFMNFRRAGKRLVVVSGCSMGLADGWRSFGALPNPLHTIKLIVNLLAYNENNNYN